VNLNSIHASLPAATGPGRRICQRRSERPLSFMAGSPAFQPTVLEATKRGESLETRPDLSVTTRRMPPGWDSGRTRDWAAAVAGRIAAARAAMIARMRGVAPVIDLSFTVGFLR